MAASKPIPQTTY